MWHQRLAILGCVLIVALTIGCPVNPTGYRFTSADLRNGAYNWWNWALPGGVRDAEDGLDGSQATREVTEPDVFRRDGNILYVLNQYRGLTLVDLDTEEILSQVPTYGLPRDLYVEEGRAYVLVGQSTDYEVDGNTVSFSVQARLYVVDVSDPSSAGIVSSFGLEGDLVDSRLVGHVLYAVCAEFDYYWEGAVATKDQTSASWVTSVNVADPNDVFQADQISFGGAGDVIQATPDAIFVASSVQWWDDDTTITYVDISDPEGAMAARGSVLVKGYVADQYKMDAWDGALRVVTSAWEDERRVYITTIDLADPDNLEPLAELELERATGETLFATRFDGPTAYVVTFLVKDPLFVIDLSDPAAPEVLGELEVPGWSTHIEPRGDRLIALGVDDTDGRRVCVSLFDVTNPAGPTLVERVTFGEGWTWSGAYDDVKAFSVFDDLLAVPFNGCSDVGGYERLQFVSWTPDDLQVRGYVDLAGAAVRAFSYETDYYGITTEQLMTIDGSDLDEPQVTNRLVLAEYVADFLELTPETGVEVVAQSDTGKTLVRTVDLAKAAGGALEVEIGDLVDSVLRGDSLILVGAKWETEAADEAYWGGSQSYMVAIIDCSDPAHPEVADLIRVPVEPYYWWYWPVYPYLELDKAAAGAKSLVPWPRYPAFNSGTVFLLGDVLALRCWADEFDTVIGTERPYEGLALLDLADGAELSTVGLGYEGIVSLDAAGGDLYLTTCESVQAATGSVAPRCAYFLTALDLGETPSAGPSVNVPGLFVQYEPETDLLTLRDDQWLLYWESRGYLRTVRWDGVSEVESIDSAQLPDGASQVLGRGSKVYVDAYDDGLTLRAITVSAEGALEAGAGVLVTTDWGSLVDARDTTAYVTIGGGAVARYDFRSGAGQLGDLVAVMSTPQRIRFGTNAAYAATGYSGVVQLPL